MSHVPPTLVRALGGLLALAVLACGAPAASAPAPATEAMPSTSPTPAAAFPRIVTDSKGTRLELAAAPRRIVSLSPGVTEVLFAVGAGPQVVATDRFSDYPAEAAKTPKLEYTQPSAEAALSYSPDLVIMTTRQQPQVEQFRSLGLPVLFMEEPKTLEAVVESVRFYGTIAGHAEEAEALAGQLRQRIDAVVAKLPPGPGPRVFFELSPDLYTVAPESFIGSMLTLLRTENVARGATTAFPQLSAEAVIAGDPQVVLLADAHERGGNQSAATVSTRPGWAATEAVRAGRIHPINSDLVNRPGPRVVDGLEQLARALYPEQFGGPAPASTSR